MGLGFIFVCNDLRDFIYFNNNYYKLDNVYID